MKIIRCGVFVVTCFVVLCLASIGLVTAAPVISVDVDPLTFGIQSELRLVVGMPLTVDIVISGVDVASPLNAFGFDLDFAPLLLDPSGGVGGGFLLPTVLVIESDLTAPDVNFAESTLGPLGATGSGILATIHFDTLGVGTSVLDLNDVLLSAPFGVPIIPVSINDAMVTTMATAVPLPPTLFLFASGIGLLGARLRKKNSRLRPQPTWK
ncbi:MAG: cohesin domain-containing protein [Gammaproteobacteria bacterium]